MDENTSLMNKNVNDLTVGDALKINLVILAAMAAIPVSVCAVVEVKERLTSWNTKRKLNKMVTTTEK